MLAFITQKKIVKEILEHLGLSTTGAPIAPARHGELHHPQCGDTQEGHVHSIARPGQTSILQGPSELPFGP